MIFVYLFVLLGLLSLIFWQYLRVAFSRIATYKLIKRLCNETGIAVKLMNRSYFLSKNSHNRFDFVLRVGDTVMPVKFYSALKGSSALQIDGSGRICIGERYAKPLSRSGKREVKLLKKYSRLPSMKLKKELMSKKHTLFPVFLNEPEFSSVKIVSPDGKLVDIYETSAEPSGCRWFDKEMLLSFLILQAKRMASEKGGDDNA